MDFIEPGILDRINSACAVTRQALLSERNRDGYWDGELSTSALSTATASFALGLLDKTKGDPRHQSFVLGGLRWLCENANSDGGWGDTVKSHSNLPTTTLAWATLSFFKDIFPEAQSSIASSQIWIESQAGSVRPKELAAAITRIYGEDKTFSVPILTLTTLAGCLGDDESGWNLFPALPFYLATLPHATFKFVGLPVVSYALPALIAMGLVHYRRSKKKNWILSPLKAALTKKSLKVLSSTQPTNGGFLEAIPLTSFVTMSLVGAGEEEHEVTQLGAEFLRNSVRPDGSWPIDTHLATWVTTLSVNALSHHDDIDELNSGKRDQVKACLLDQQYTSIHPYTQAQPGAWAWTHLPGGVPDADDTAGALLALGELGNSKDSSLSESLQKGLQWLLDLQNRDGGIPTFCRGWGKLPFDRSGADLTAHAIRAFERFHSNDDLLGSEFRHKLKESIQKGIRYLIQVQETDGSWLPLWFGNQDCEGFKNRVFGTTRVLTALLPYCEENAEVKRSCQSAIDFLYSVQAEDGGWGGGDANSASSIEETALSIEVLTYFHSELGWGNQEKLFDGLRWLLDKVEDQSWKEPSPIGFYFANLWYYEKLYPQIFTVSALGRVKKWLEGAPNL